MSMLAVLVNPFYYQRLKVGNLASKISKDAYERALGIIGDSRVIIHHTFPTPSFPEEQALLEQWREKREWFFYPPLEEAERESYMRDWVFRRYRRESIDLYVFGEPLSTLPEVALDLQRKLGVKIRPTLVIPGIQRGPNGILRKEIPRIIRGYVSKMDFILEDFGNA